jgi:hypothetical protein
MTEQEVYLRGKFNRKKSLLLVAGIVLDGIGIVTYVIPGITELLDIAWAPVAGMIYFAMYGGIAGAFGGFFTFLEELFIFTDWIPSFTITWLIKYGISGEKAFKKFQEKNVVAPTSAQTLMNIHAAD